MDPIPLLTASNYGGSKHPQWYYNLTAHPECELGRREISSGPSEITDPEMSTVPLMDAGYKFYACWNTLLSPQDRPDWPSYPRLSAQTALAAATTR